MNKSIITIAVIVLSVVSLPVYAKGKPANPGGGKPDKDNSGPVVESVCIDPGHGGTQPGTISPNGEIEESDLNLEVALELERLLDDNGYTVALTRDTDVTLSNNDRYTFCNEQTDATTLISIHHNGSTNQSVDYSLGLYHNGSNRELAAVVTDAVASEFDNPNAGTDRFPSGVLIKSDMPSMMSEGYFLTNTDRQAELTTDRDGMVLREAQALYDGIATYYAAR